MLFPPHHRWTSCQDNSAPTAESSWQSGSPRVDRNRQTAISTHLDHCAIPSCCLELASPPPSMVTRIEPRGSSLSSHRLPAPDADTRAVRSGGTPSSRFSMVSTMSPVPPDPGAHLACCLSVLGASSLRSSTPPGAAVASEFFHVIETLSAVIGSHLHRPTLIPGGADVSVMLAEREGPDLGDAAGRGAEGTDRRAVPGA